MSELCWHFNTTRGCRFGDQCHFRHERVVCRFLNTSEGCRFGDRCKFLHELPTSVASTNSVPSTRPVEPAAGNNTVSQLPTTTAGNNTVSQLSTTTAGNNTVSQLSLPTAAADSVKCAPLPLQDRTNTVLHTAAVNTGSVGNATVGLKDVDDAMARLKMTSQYGPLMSDGSSSSDVENDEAAVGTSETVITSVAAAAEMKKPKKKNKGKKARMAAKKKAKCKELIVNGIQLVKCGECSTVFNAGANNTENWTALRSHYVEMFGRVDQQHMKFFHDNAVVLAGGSTCGVCSAAFTRPSDLFRHLANKARGANAMEALPHHSFFEAIALPFVGVSVDPDWPGDVPASPTQLFPIPDWDFLEHKFLRRMSFLHNSVENPMISDLNSRQERDTGLVTAPGQMLNHLRLMLSGDFVDDSDDDDDDDDDDSDDDDMDLATFAFMMKHTLDQNMRREASRQAAAGRGRGGPGVRGVRGVRGGRGVRGRPGVRGGPGVRGVRGGRGGRGFRGARFGGLQLALPDSDSDDGGMFGFSGSDVEELLCQGIKPWDDCAWRALAVLNGDDDYY